jgi:hypothetical protein
MKARTSPSNLDWAPMSIDSYAKLEKSVSRMSATLSMRLTNIAFAPWVPILIPCSANAGVLLIYDQLSFP